MKKIICLLLILSFAVSLISCGAFGASNSINGESLKDYSIVYSEEDHDYSKRAAEYIQSEILARTKINLPLIEDSEDAVTENEIVVGNTERAISEKLNAETVGLQFAILADQGDVALEGDYFIIAAAAYFFIETYVPTADYDATVPEEVKVHSPIVKEAKNFIMLIGDGMGINQTKMFEYLENDREYSDGEDMFYGYYLPAQGQSRTASLSGVTDSAAGGTALSCGIKTINGFVGRDENLNDVKSLTELAHENGMSAGVMSTEVKTGATPAAFSSHADARYDDAGIIISQLEAQTKYGTVIECGFDYYTERYIEKTVEKKITDMLSKLSANKKGFFLMYEEAHIDKHSHNNELDKAFDAIVRFNQAIGRFMEFAFYNPDTFILITADHETGDLFPNSEGVLEYHSEDHTGKNVPIFAYGAGSELFNGQKIENIQIAHTIAHFMGVDNFGDQSTYQYLGK
ncbi:MAG: alkaline phosphatase [Clostridia bacterium]|nr:alkaline phosphatase [Clostridia bacterium]